MLGGVVSTNVMCCVQIEVPPPGSVAVQMRSMPARPVQLVGVATSVNVIVGLPLQPATAVAAPVVFVAVESPHCNCRSAGQRTCSVPLPVTVTVCVQLLVLPCTSTAVQSTVLVPSGNCVGALLVTLATAQLSAVTGLPRLRLLIVQEPAGALVRMLAGQAIVGSWVSRTITVCAQLLLLPWTSTTVQVTRLVPTGNVAGALLVTLATLQLSPVSGEPSATPVAKHCPALALVVTLAGQLIVGACVSVTVTVCWQVFVWPQPSVTVQMTIVVPSGNCTGALLVTLATRQLSELSGEPDELDLGDGRLLGPRQSDYA